MHLIYMITNPHTKLSYVGLTKNLKKRLYQHKRDFTVECDDFNIEVIFDNIPSLAEANEMEKVFIDVHHTFDNGYNKTRGGGRKTEVSEETKIKLSKSNSGENNGFYGKKHNQESLNKMRGRKFSDEHRQKISEDNKRNPRRYWLGKTRSEETNQKISKSLKGRKIPKETRQKISKSNSGENNAFYGKKHTLESRLKMSETKRRKNNPNQLTLF